ncbi:hypothetical protein WJX84_006212 [Apatococcus fuscideae]|uniref:Calponin-homology (CH) domain-containing protein n=1 Tax=Apatococcus fuscideae TaxID=2026836 RepID=A0AAW1RQY6_9CHLO
MPGLPSLSPETATHPSIRVVPTCLEFSHLAHQEQACVKICVQNTGKHTRHVRARRSSSAFCRLLGLESPICLAPGLQKVLQVTCQQLPETQAFRESFIICADDGDEIEVLCTKTCQTGKSVMLEGSLDFGDLTGPTKVSKVTRLTNFTQHPVPFSVVLEGRMPVLVTPMSGELGPAGSDSSTQKLQVELRATFPESIQGQVKVVTEGADVHDVLISDIAAQVTTSSLEAMDPASPSKPLKRLDFGLLHHGDSKVVTFQVVNSSNMTAVVHAACGLPQDFNDADRSAKDLSGFVQAARRRAKLLKAAAPPPFTIAPAQAQVKAGGRLELQVTFQPASKDSESSGVRGSTAAPPSEEPFGYVCQLRAEGPGTTLMLPLRGAARIPCLSIKPRLLQFGAVPMGTSSELPCRLANDSDKLMLRYSIAQTASFHCKPAHGAILPGAETPLLVTYNPKALGPQQTQLEVHVLTSNSTAVVWTRPILVTGLADAQAINPAEQHAQAKSLGKLQGSPSWAAGNFLMLPEVQAQFNDIPMDEQHQQHTWTLPCALKKAEHTNKRIVSDLRRNRSTHQTTARAVNELNKPQDLGLWRMRPKSPGCALTRQMEQELTAGLSQVNQPRSRALLGPEALDAIALYKVQPSTDCEWAEVNKPLSKQELESIAVGPRHVDFGRVRLSAIEARHITVFNPLRRHLHIVLATDRLPELSLTEPVSQLIPPGAVAKFKLVLNADEEQSFVEDLEYIINGSQIFSLQLRADVEPASLQLSAHELDFDFGEADSAQPWVQKNLVVRNEEPFSCNFRWTLREEASAWTVEPQEGCVGPNSSLPALIRWTPLTETPPGEHLASMTLDVEGAVGDKKMITLRGVRPESNICFCQKVLDLGAVPVGALQKAMAVIRNIGQSDAIFEVVPHDILMCTPDRARVPKGASLSLDIAMSVMVPRAISTFVALDVHAGKAAKLMVKADVVLPAVEVAEASYEFGEVSIGATTKLPVTVTNPSAVSAALTIGLAMHPQFKLELPRDSWSMDDYDESPLSVISAAATGSATASRRTSRSRTRETRGTRSTRQTGEGDSSEGSNYMLRILPRKVMKLLLVFKAAKNSEYSFMLDFKLLGAGQSIEDAVITRSVTAKALRAQLLASNVVVNFATCVVHARSQASEPHTQDLSLTSNVNRQLTLHIGAPSTDKQDGARGVFTVEPREAVLDAGDSVFVTISFAPIEHMRYSAIVPVFLDGNLAKSYLDIRVDGEGQDPSLRFGVRECILPTVPLNVKSQAVVEIFNEGFDNLELQAHLPADAVHCPIEVSFPEGNLIGTASYQLPLLVTFISDVPMSFSTSIAIEGSDGSRFPLLVSATADASLLTLQTFIEMNSQKLVWTRQPAQAPGINVEARGLKTPLTNLPVDIAASKGRLMLDLVSLLAGKSISEKVINKVTNKKEAALQQLKNMESMTSFLISHGALLGAIRPALLLDAEDFRQILADKEAAASSHDDHEELQWWFDVEEGFQEQRLSEKAWNAIAAQVVRVMALAQVTWKGLRILPGMENCQIPPEIFTTGSNVYSPGECTLMAWLTAHLQKVFASSAKPSVVANFDIDLSNGLALYAVLVDYWPALLAKGSKLNKAPTTAVHMSENAKAVCNMINQLQLAMSIKVDDILQPNPVNMMIFVLYLFNTLPQLIPKSTVVFSSKLQETQVSCVQLNNSGTRPLIYTARLDGPVDFSLDVHEVRLGPKASQRLPIMCTPPTTKPQAGHLILTSDKGSHLPTSTLVFALQSVLDTRTPLAIFHCAGPLYELAEFDVSVTNPFDLDCDFSLTIVNASSDQLDADLTMPRSHAEDSTQHAHARPSHDLLSQRSTRDHPASSYDGPRVLQDALIRLESHSQRPSNAGDSSADAHYRIFPEAFGTDRGRVRIKGKLEEPVRVSFLPFKLATHKACMILEDSICGKFVIELVAEVSLPKPSTRLSFQMTGEGSQSMEVPVSWPNVQIETARRIFLERHPLARSKLEAAIAKAEGLELPHVLHFRVEHSSSFMQMPNTLVVAKNPTAAAAYGQQHDASLPTVKEHGHREYSRHGPPRKPAGTHPGHPSKARVHHPESHRGQGHHRDGHARDHAHGHQKDATVLAKEPVPAPPNMLRVTCNPQEAGTYQVHIVLSSLSDVRVLVVEMVARRALQPLSLVLESPARHKTTQEVGVATC